jgi:peptidase S41-like protein
MARKVGLTREESWEEYLDAVAERLEKSMSLARFMKQFNKAKLSKTDRLEIIEQALVLLEMNYVHLPLKRAMHAIDPLQKLRRLKFQILEMKEGDLPADMIFHQEMQKVFLSTRDIHTSYSLPAPFNRMTAYLPFIIEDYYVKRGKRYEPRYMVSHVARSKQLALHAAKGEDYQPFREGVEVMYWNGVPIRRAVELNGERQAGSNLEARVARGLDSMTIRPLVTSLPPDEMWAVITYRTEDQRTLELKLEWRVYDSKPKRRALPKSLIKRKANLGLDMQKDAINQVKKSLFAPETKNPDLAQKHREEVEKTSMPTVFRARRYTVAGREYGYIRIFTFYVDDVEEFVGEFIRLARRLPQEGLILDVRGNGGGYIEAGERLLQLLTPRRIKPALFEFINTPMNLEICRRAPKYWEFRAWADSIMQAVATGATYSQALPLTSEEACNEIGQIYYGPVLLITDALCYSTTDIFAAGFQDNQVGEILGTSGNTGAGGANVVKHNQLIEWTSRCKNTPLMPLPRGVSMRVALRRSMRVGKHAGRPLEELGIEPDRRYYLTRDDVLNGNIDLMRRAAEILGAKPVYGLSVQIKRSGKQRTIVARTKNISRLDVYIDDHPYASVEVKRDGLTEINDVPIKMGLTKLRLEGYDSAGSLVARSLIKC